MNAIVLDPQTQLNLSRYAEDAYLQYAITTVKDRALAQVEDGLKPVQRRILYAMRLLGLNPSAKPVKSARVVGDVLGKFHPHGDSSVYDAMVRMAQDFTLRYPLIEGQGNFGSLDGDSAAAMRYTETRLSAFSELLLAELGQGTVDFNPNYDGTLQEPRLLPSRLPFLLLNGTMGIAVGMAADIAPHNLREVAEACILVVENPAVSLDQVLQHILGPDFPGGGQLVSPPEDIKNVYSAGRGTLRCRARWVKEDLARSQWQIVLTELPYQVSTRKILEQLDVLTNPSPPAGKKTITQQQANLKQLALEYLEKAVDESDKDNRIRLVLTPRNSKVDPELMMAFLLANTSLEDTVSMNMTLVGLDGRPKTMGLMDVLGEWSTYRLSTVRRRTAHELDVARKRIHILEGRMSVFLNLTAVIQAIRESDEPKADLMAKFALSEIQSEDILEMRLRQLNRLEGFKLEKELSELRKEEARLVKLLASDKDIRALIVTELRVDSGKAADDRRTLIKPTASARLAVQARTVVDEPLTVVVSKNLWVKAYKGHALPDDSFTFKQGDGPGFKVQTKSVHPVVVLDTKGRAYSFACADVPSGRGEGIPLGALIDLQAGAKLLALLSGSGEEEFVFAGDQGCGFRAPLKNLVARPKAGKSFVAVADGEVALLPQPVLIGEAGYLVCASSVGKLLAFALAEVPVRPNGGKGSVLMALGEGETMPKLWLTPGEPFSFPAVSAAGKPVAMTLKGEHWLKHVSRRGKKGSMLAKKEMPVF